MLMPLCGPEIAQIGDISIDTARPVGQWQVGCNWERRQAQVPETSESLLLLTGM